MDDVIALARDALEPFLKVANLTDLYNAYKSIPFDYVLAGHCLFAAAMAPDFKHRFLVHFWITFLAGFGGGVITSILMMDPVKAPINILANNTVGVTWLVCWWLINYSPFNLVGRIHSLLPFRMATKACVSFLRANLIINRVDLAVSMYPGVIAAPLILGTLAGSGGKLVTDGIRGGWGALPSDAEASVPGFVWRSAALAAGGYWFACKYTSLLSSQEAAALVITVLLLHSILSDLFGPRLTDFTYPVARIAHTLSLVPMPSSAPAPSPAAKAAKKAAEQAPRQQAKAAVAAVGQQDTGKQAQQGAQQQGAESHAAAPQAGKAAAVEVATSKASAGKNNAAPGAASAKADIGAKQGAPQPAASSSGSTTNGKKAAAAEGAGAAKGAKKKAAAAEAAAEAANGWTRVEGKKNR